MTVGTTIIHAPDNVCGRPIHIFCCDMSCTD